MNCPMCGNKCVADFEDLPVDRQCTPWFCWECYWTEDETADQAVELGVDEDLIDLAFDDLAP